MTVDKSVSKVTYEDDNARRLRWTRDSDPRINLDGDRRWSTVTPMASDGKCVYAMVLTTEGRVDADRRGLYIEKYEFKANKLKFVSAKKLVEADGEPWKGRKGNDKGEFDNYLNFGYLACNGAHVVWASRRHYHIFDLATGKRCGKKKVHTGREHVTCMDPDSYKFYCQDADVYSWLQVVEIPGFEKLVEEEEAAVAVNLPPIKYSLDEKKNEVKQSVRRVKEP